jgi:hypothetical protein
VELARRSIAVAASFGLASALSVVVLGDESGYSASHTQKMKLAAIEAMWETDEAPAPFTAFGFPTRRRARPITPSRSPGHGPDRHALADRKSPASTSWWPRPKFDPLRHHRL